AARTGATARTGAAAPGADSDPGPAGVTRPGAADPGAQASGRAGAADPRTAGPSGRAAAGSAAADVQARRGRLAGRDPERLEARVLRPRERAADDRARAGQDLRLARPLGRVRSVGALAALLRADRRAQPRP